MSHYIPLVAAIALIVLISVAFVLFSARRLVAWERRGHDYLMTYESPLGRYQVIGSCTVWYSYPGFRRQGTFEEAAFCDDWKRCEHLRKHHGIVSWKEGEPLPEGLK